MSKTVNQDAQRRLTYREEREIETVIQQAKGDEKPHSAQDSIPFDIMYPDGLCRLGEKSWSKCIEFEDANYQFANADDKTAVFENLCDFYNYYDASIGIQLSLISRYANKEDFQKTTSIPPQNNNFDGIRTEYTGMLQGQLARGNNGLVKTKFLTPTIEADNIQAARSRLGRIEADTLNQFKVMGAAARVLNGRHRLSVIHGIFHPEGSVSLLNGTGSRQAASPSRTISLRPRSISGRRGSYVLARSMALFPFCKSWRRSSMTVF